MRPILIMPPYVPGIAQEMPADIQEAPNMRGG